MLASTAADKLETLTAVLYDLDAQMADSLWPALIEARIPIDHTIDRVPDTDFETILWSN